MLRNPNLSVFGTAYPNNVYVIECRTILPISAEQANVNIVLTVYTDDTKVYKIREHIFGLSNLVNDPVELGPVLYQTKLLEQHGTEEVDGTVLNEYTVL